MLDHVEPLHALLWFLFFISSCLYPLGILLPCSECCGGDGDGDGDCPSPIEFNRCVRIEDPAPAELPSTFSKPSDVTTAIYGWSKPIRKITDIGAHRVATRYELTGQLVVSGDAARMSAEEQSKAVYKLHLRTPSWQPGKALGEVRVTLDGVTRPLTVVDTPPPQTALFYAEPTATAEWSYRVSNSQESVNAVVSVEAAECRILSGSEWIDGSEASQQVLKGFVSGVLTPSYHTYYDCTLTATVNASLFKYVPRNTPVVLRYVVDHKRGDQHTYKTVQLTILKLSPAVVTPLPEEGITTYVNPPQATFSDSVLPSTLPVFDEDPESTDEYPIKTIVLDSTKAGITLSMPTISYTLVGNDFLSTGFLCVVTQGQYLSTSFFGPSNSWGWPYNSANGDADFEYSTQYVSAYDLKFIMRLSLGDNRFATQWNFNHEQVAEFLDGETLDVDFEGYYDGDAPDPILGYQRSSDPVTRRITISPANSFCGVPLCSSSSIYVTSGESLLVRNYDFSQVISNTVTYTAAKFPATAVVNDETGSRTVENKCSGADTEKELILRRTQGCTYSGLRTTCEGSGRLSDDPSFFQEGPQALGPETISGFARVNWFFCGDLLWAIENGTCRDSVDIPGVLYEGGHGGQGTYALNGDDSKSYKGPLCELGWPTNDSCPAIEAIVTVPASGVYYSAAGASVTGERLCQQIGTAAGGDVVAMTQSLSCTRHLYSGYIPYSVTDNPFSLTDGSVPLVVTRWRHRWCEAWNDFSQQVGGGPCLASGCNQSNVQMCLTIAGGEFPEEEESYESTVEPADYTVEADGGDFSLEWKHPDATVDYSMGPSVSRFDRHFTLDNGSGATAYITQTGLGESFCPFEMTWYLKATGTGVDSEFNNFSVMSHSSLEYGIQGRVYVRSDCHTYGVPVFAEQPPCEWSVAKEGDWFTAKKSDDGKYVVLIDTFGEGGSPLPGVLTITAGDNTLVVEVHRVTNQ